MRIMPINVYQFSDLVELQPYDDGISLQTILTEYQINYSIEQNSMIETLFKKIYNRFNTYELFEISACDSSETKVRQLLREWIIKFINEYENTKMYYETLIKAYENSLPTIMNDVEATTENEVVFNDTPQVEGGIFKTNDYATTYTKTGSTSKSPMKTPIERLKDIQDNLRNLWKDLTNHFHLLFVEKQEGVLYEELI